MVKSLQAVERTLRPREAAAGHRGDTDTTLQSDAENFSKVRQKELT